jgi:hypothetical protein
MWIDILNKVFVFLLILSILNVTRNCFFLIRNFKAEERFVLNKSSLLYLGLSISYIGLFIIEGVKF